MERESRLLWIRRSKCNLYGTRRASSPGVSLFSALPVLFLALTLPNQTHANGALNAYQVYDAQLCRATVEVIAFDLARLNENTAPDAINRGLERRLRTFASPLVWLCRRAVTISPSSVRTTLTALQAAINARHYFGRTDVRLSPTNVSLIPASGPMNAPLCMRSSRQKWSTSNIVGLVIALTPAVKIPQSGSTRCVSARVRPTCRATRTGRSRTSVNGYRNPLTQKDIRGLNALMAR